MNNETSIRKTIYATMIDEEGNYKIGLENAVTPEKIIELSGSTWNGDRGNKFYQCVRIELNAVCAILCKQGYCAGGIGRCPTHYFIAKNPSEELLITAKSARYTYGRIVLIGKRGKNIIAKRAISAIQNQLIPLLDIEESEFEEMAGE